MKKFVLMVAVWKGNVEIVEYLLEHGADPYLKNSSGLTAMGLALGSAAESDDPDFQIVEKLAVFGISPCDKDLIIFSNSENGDQKLVTIVQLVNDTNNMKFLSAFKKFECTFE